MSGAAPLSGVLVVELAGLAPVPFAGMVLADMGAEVIRVDRPTGVSPPNPLGRGKKSVSLDLKKQADRDVFLRLTATADVLLDPYRPGVLERLGLAPDALRSTNPRLIIARLTGYGQGGVKQAMVAPGHDINYLAQAGVLEGMKHPGGTGVPVPPTNLLADFIGGGMMCAVGVLLALLERKRSGLGQVVDAAMADGAAYLMAPLFQGGGGNRPASHRCYECADGKFLAVAASDPEEEERILGAVGCPRDRLAATFAHHPQDYWATRLASLPSVRPLRSPDAPGDGKEFLYPDGQARPCPLFLHLPTPPPPPKPGQHTEEVLAKL